MRITLIQMESTGTKKENEEKTFHLLKQAILEKPDIICLSELFLSWGTDFNSGIVQQKDIQKYQTFAKENHVNLILGSVALKSNIDGKVTNTCFSINRSGEIAGRYDKKHMYTVKHPEFSFDEADDTIPGKNLGITELDHVKIGIGICFDLRYPEYFRRLIQRGVKIIFLPSHFNLKTGKLAWDVLTKARAIENQVYFCACNQTGNKLCGNSKVLSYSGKILKSLGKEEGLLTIDIDLEEQERFRKEFPVLEQIDI